MCDARKPTGHTRLVRRMMADRALVQLRALVGWSSEALRRHLSGDHQPGERSLAPVMGRSLTHRGSLHH
jgi:hypothetical protein